MKIKVDVEYTIEKDGIQARGHDKAVLTDEHPASSYRIPVLLFRGEPLGIVDMALNGLTKIRVVWRKERTGPVWNLLKKAMDVGLFLNLSWWYNPLKKSRGLMLCNNLLKSLLRLYLYALLSFWGILQNILEMFGLRYDLTSFLGKDGRL